MDLDLVIRLGIGLGIFSGPVPALIVSPHPLSRLSVLADHFALAFSLAVRPLTLEYAAIGPFVLAKPMFLIVLVLSFIAAAVLPNMNTISMHLIQLPLSLILPAIAPDVFSVTVDLVLVPRSRVVTSIGP